MGLTDPDFIETRESITGQAGKVGAPVLQADFGATDPVGFVHAQAKADELEDLLKGMRGGPDDDVLAGGRQRRNGKRQDGTLDLLSSRGLNNIMNDILMQQTMDMMDRIIELGRELTEARVALKDWASENLSEADMKEIEGLPPELQSRRILEIAREKHARGELSDEALQEAERHYLKVKEREEKLDEFFDEHIDQIRQAAFQYEALIKKREELSTKIDQNDRLSTRLDELRSEGENERTTQELDGIIRTRSDLEIRLSGDETYHERIDAVDAAVEQQTIKLTQDLGEVGTAIEAMEEANETLTVNGWEEQIVKSQNNGAVIVAEQADDMFASLGLKDGFQSAHNDEQPTTTADTNEVDPADVKIAAAKPITFGNDVG